MPPSDMANNSDTSSIDAVSGRSPLITRARKDELFGADGVFCIVCSCSLRALFFWRCGQAMNEGISLFDPAGSSPPPILVDRVQNSRKSQGFSAWPWVNIVPPPFLLEVE